MKRNLLKLALCAMALLPIGAWADETTWTWNFTDNATWTTAKVVTNSAVTLNPSAATPGTGEHGVTFNFATDKASVTSSGLGFLSDNRSSSTEIATSDYVSISIPAGFKATFTFTKNITSSRAIYYAIDDGATVTVSSGTSFYKTNEGESPVTMTVWARNPVKDGKSENIISTIVLEDVSSVTYHSWTVYAKIKDTDTQIDTWTVDEIAEGDAFNAYLKKVIKYNEQYYELNDDTYTNLYISDTMGDDDKTYYVEYVLAEDIVFYKEGEAITQSNTLTTCSGGAYCGFIGRPVDASAIIIPGAGQYRAEALVMSTRTSPVLTLWKGTNIDSSTNNPTDITIGDGNAGVKYSETFTVNADTTYYVGGPSNDGTGYSNSLAFDYILVRKTAVLATISSAGWTSLASAYILNYAGAEKKEGVDLKAYAISNITKTSVTLTPHDAAPAGVGMILKGKAGSTYTIPVTTSADTFDNELSAAVKATTVAANSVYAVSGGKLKLFTGTEVPAGKAYLLASKVPDEARGLSLVFDEEGETTGIAEINSKKGLLDGDFYDLSGRKVAQPTKGLYIMNGRKVIVK